MSIGYKKTGYPNQGNGESENTRFTQLGTIDRLDVNVFMFNGTVTEFAWLLLGGDYYFDTTQELTIDFTSGAPLRRIDISFVDTTNNVIKYLAGDEQEGIPQPPLLPANCLLLATWIVDDKSVSDPLIINLGQQYVQKAFFQEYRISDDRPIMDIFFAGGRTAFEFITSTEVFDFKGFENVEGFRAEYDGKQYSLKNSTEHIINLVHNSGDVELGFNFQSGDYKLQPGELIVLKRSFRGLEKFGSSINGNYIEVTLDQLNDLIAVSGLIPSAFYKVTGVNLDLYGGTTIFIQAISNKKLSATGIGEFFTPKYNQLSEDNGIWNNKINYGITNDAIPSPGLLVTTNTGATGRVLSGSVIEYISGDWNGSTEIFELGSGYSAEIEIINLPNYTVGQKVIYGYKFWLCVTEGIGNNDGLYTLINNWQEVEFDIDDYNVTYDEIEYDVQSDMIISRSSKTTGETVSNSISDVQFFILNDGFDYNPIKCYQWGNPFNDALQKGNKNNSIRNSLFDCINSKSSKICDNTLSNKTVVKSCEFKGLSLTGNTLISGFLSGMISFSESVFANNTIVASTVQGYLGANSEFSNNQIVESNIGTLQLNNSTTWLSTAKFSSNNIFKSMISKLKGIDEFEFIGNSMHNAILNNETSAVIEGKKLSNIEFRDVNVTESLDAATFIFEDYSKKIIKANDGTSKMVYLGLEGYVFRSVNE